jgi:hypothetical protein
LKNSGLETRTFIAPKFKNVSALQFFSSCGCWKMTDFLEFMVLTMQEKLLEAFRFSSDENPPVLPISDAGTLFKREFPLAFLVEFEAVNCRR